MSNWLLNYEGVNKKCSYKTPTSPQQFVTQVESKGCNGHNLGSNKQRFCQGYHIGETELFNAKTKQFVHLTKYIYADIPGNQ